MKKYTGMFLALLLSLQILAREGMWVPTLLGKYNIEEMQSMGFKLTAQDIYDINQASMKDAVIIFGSGCTGELISEEGLIITNHHCGYGQIQSHSSVEYDYLTDGFWAMDKSEELPNPGLTVSFLEYMQDVTEEVLYGTKNLSETEKQQEIARNISRLEREASQRGKFSVQIKPLFYSNQYFLYVYKVYRDIRLVGAPPSSIGKFGGDTDNWMWPRHTGDFSLFRIYSGKDNEPADYSPENVPFKPKMFFPVSLKGIEQGDFTMVFGNPGRTYQYIPSHEVDIIMNQRDPDRINIRDIKLEIIAADMENDSKVRIQYSAKYQSISNAWKKWQGEIKGLERLDAVNKKIEFENEFKLWAENNGTWQNEYQPVFNEFSNLYSQYREYIKASDYYAEIVLNGIEIFKMASMINSVINSIENRQTLSLPELKINAAKNIDVFRKDFNQPTDEKLFAALLPVLLNDLDRMYLPTEFIELMKKNSFDKLVAKVYRKSDLLNFEKVKNILENGTDAQLLNLRKDPLFVLSKALYFHHDVKIKPVVDSLTVAIDRNMKTYMAGIMQMKAGQAFYPDANLTLRVTYGNVEGYEPVDGVKFKYYTTLTGIMEKENPEIYDYNVPERLKELYREKDFGPYEVNGTVPVCFTASNHTSGGNSGSPVINATGELIGINFDRCWEGTMSDIMYDPEMSRNISVDIRYVLFIIDKYAGAGYLLEEMEIIY